MPTWHTLTERKGRSRPKRSSAKVLDCVALHAVGLLDLASLLGIYAINRRHATNFALVSSLIKDLKALAPEEELERNASARQPGSTTNVSSQDWQGEVLWPGGWSVEAGVACIRETLSGAPDGCPLRAVSATLTLVEAFLGEPNNLHPKDVLHRLLSAVLSGSAAGQTVDKSEIWTALMRQLVDAIARAIHRILLIEARREVWAAREGELLAEGHRLHRLAEMLPIVSSH